MSPLIDSTRAAQNSQLAALNSSNPTLLTSLLAASSDLIRRYCHRDFTQQTYTEFYSGGIYVREPLKLRQFPVTRVQRVGIANRAMLVTNGGIAQMATVETDGSNNIILNTIANGVVAAPVTLAAATYTTLGLMAAAIIASGNGWQCAVYSGAAGDYGGFPTTDLKPLQGAASAKAGGSFIEIYEDWLGWNSVAFWPDEQYEFGAVAPFWRLDDQTGEMWGHMPRGFMNLRIIYQAGFAAIPDAVQEACAQTCIWLNFSGLVNMSLKSERLGPASYELRDKIDLPRAVQMLIDPYKAYDKGIYRN